MLYKEKSLFFPEVHTHNRKIRCEHQVEFLMLNLVVRKATAGI